MRHRLNLASLLAATIASYKIAFAFVDLNAAVESHSEQRSYRQLVHSGAPLAAKIEATIKRTSTSSWVSKKTTGLIGGLVTHAVIFFSTDNNSNLLEDEELMWMHKQILKNPWAYMTIVHGPDDEHGQPLEEVDLVAEDDDGEDTNSLIDDTAKLRELFSSSSEEEEGGGYRRTVRRLRAVDEMIQQRTTLTLLTWCLCEVAVFSAVLLSLAAGWRRPLWPLLWTPLLTIVTFLLDDDDLQLLGILHYLSYVMSFDFYSNRPAIHGFGQCELFLASSPNSPCYPLKVAYLLESPLLYLCIHLTYSKHKPGSGLEPDTPIALLQKKAIWLLRICMEALEWRRSLFSSRRFPREVVTSDSGDSRLTLACREGRADSVQQLLLDRPVDVNRANLAGETPLVAAARNGFETVVAMLLKHGSLNLSDGLGEAAVREAVAADSYEVAAVISSAMRERGVRFQNENLERFLQTGVNLSRAISRSNRRENAERKNREERLRQYKQLMLAEAPPSEANNDDGRELVSQLVRLFECPVCMDSLAGSKVFACGNDHWLCHRCFDRRDECPTCKEAFETSSRRRCHKVESAAEIVSSLEQCHGATNETSELSSMVI